MSSVNRAFAAATAQRMGVFEPSLLRANRLFESRDLDDTRERISRVMQPHKLQPLAHAGAGTGRAHMDFVRLGGVGLGAIEFGEAMRVHVEEIEDYHLLMFCLRGNARVLADGEPLQASTSQGIICPPGRSFVADLSPDCEQFVVRLDRRMVEAHCGRAIRFHETLDLRRPQLQGWLDQLRVLATSPTMLQAAQRNPLIAVELERLLVHLLLEGQAWTDASAPAIRNSASAVTPPGIASACVRRAEAYMDAHAADAVCLEDIATAAGVPARTLLDAFKRFRGTSPMQHLRALRLDRVHALLQQADADGQAQVATLAMDCGFVHLGRFSQAYRERFGQVPSATLRARG